MDLLSTEVAGKGVWPELEAVRKVVCLGVCVCMCLCVCVCEVQNPQGWGGRGKKGGLAVLRSETGRNK